MEYRVVPKTGDRLSALGLGCMRLPVSRANGIDEKSAVHLVRSAIDLGINYFDTAPAYHLGRSESLLGRALLGGYREQVRIATKLPPWSVHSRRDMDQILRNQLKKLQTDHIDYYLLHSLEQQTFENLCGQGVFDFLDSAMDEGYIVNRGFSFHGTPGTFREIVDSYPWEFCQVQYNYLDVNSQAGTQGLEYAASRNLAVMVMEPLRGGCLAGPIPPGIQEIWEQAPVRRSPAEWGLRFVLDRPEVTVVLSGMNQVSQLEENTAIADDTLPGSLTPVEQALISRVRDAYIREMKVGCTGCRYCMPCPAGVDIPECFSLYNGSSMFPGRHEYRFHYLTRHCGVTGSRTNAGLCRGCGLCEKKCPQHLPVRASLQEVSEKMEGKTLGIQVAALKSGLFLMNQGSRLVRGIKRGMEREETGSGN